MCTLGERKKTTRAEGRREGKGERRTDICHGIILRLHLIHALEIMFGKGLEVGLDIFEGLLVRIVVDAGGLKMG